MQTSIVVKREEIKSRVEQLGAEIVAALKSDGLEQICMLWLAEGAIMFAADLSRAMGEFPMKIKSIRVCSYGESFKSGGKASFDADFSEFKNCDVLLVDDVIDSGTSARALIAELKNAGAASVRTCFLFDKKNSIERSDVPVDFCAFEVPDFYIFGYGLDLMGTCRNYPDVYRVESL